MTFIPLFEIINLVSTSAKLKLLNVIYCRLIKNHFLPPTYVYWHVHRLLRKDSQLRLRDYSGVENIHQNNNVDLIEVDSINNGIGNGVDNNSKFRFRIEKHEYYL